MPRLLAAESRLLDSKNSVEHRIVSTLDASYKVFDSTYLTVPRLRSARYLLGLLFAAQHRGRFECETPRRPGWHAISCLAHQVVRLWEEVAALG